MIVIRRFKDRITITDNGLFMYNLQYKAVLPVMKLCYGESEERQLLYRIMSQDVELCRMFFEQYWECLPKEDQ